MAFFKSPVYLRQAFCDKKLTKSDEKVLHSFISVKQERYGCIDTLFGLNHSYIYLYLCGFQRHQVVKTNPPRSFYEHAAEVLLNCTCIGFIGMLFVYKNQRKGSKKSYRPQTMTLPPPSARL